jgi:AraC-like DNA-binding protein
MTRRGHRYPSGWNLGEANPAAKITAKRAREIRKMRNETKLSFVKLAKIVGLSPSHVHRICTGGAWSRHVCVIR